jgi:uncharacterized protein YunC (DUF1805 family)
MMQMTPVKVGDTTAVGIFVELPKTRILAVATEKGYIMCGLIDLARLDTLRPERRILAARVTHVRTIEDLLAGSVDQVTQEARRLGITEGMTGLQALEKMV